MSISKLNAFKYHIFISLFVLSTSIFVILSYWFPYPLFFLDGTWFPIALLLSVDLVLGPIITLLVIKESKTFRENLFDFLCILTIQISALGYGLITIYQERIIALVHLDSTFHLVTARDTDVTRLPISSTYLEQQNLPLFLIEESVLADYYQQNTKPILFEPSQYKSIDLLKINKNQFDRNFLPSDLKHQYSLSGDVIFKVVVGKKRNALIAFQDNMTPHLHLLPDNKTMEEKLNNYKHH